MPKFLAKKLFSICMAIVMICCMFSALVVSAAAPTSYTTMYLGDVKSVSITSSGGCKYFKFVPEYSGSYSFYSTGSVDSYGYLLDSTGTQLTYDDDAGDDLNFNITYSLTAGNTYYLKAAMFSSNTGSYSATVIANFTIPSVVQIQEGTNTYSLFNSGATSSDGYEYYNSSGSDYNPNSHSYNNNGYDIYGYSGGVDLTIGMGLYFYIESEVTEQAILTVYAYDIDEERNQIDDVYLVNAQTGVRTKVGTLSGLNQTWSTTTITIDPSYFEVGQTYYFEDDVCYNGWYTWIRTVSLQMTCGEYVPTTILDHSFTASIDNNGYVYTDLYIITDEDITYNLEYTATINGQQKGAKNNAVIDVSTYGTSVSDGFQLESDAPTGTYEICVIVKDTLGNTVVTYTVTAGYDYSAVSYDPNGGSNNLPLDSNAYSNGDIVTVLFNNIPSRQGYTFLGWSTNPNANTPDYTEYGLNTFIIGSNDVTLYAIWSQDLTPDSPAFVVDNATTHPGQEFTVAIRTQNNPGIVSFKLEVDYDSDILELVSAEQQAFTGMTFGPIDNDPFIVNWVDAINPDNTTDDVVVLLTFRVKDDAPFGNTNISLSYDPYDVYNDNWDNVTFATVDGVISIIDYTLGDVNDDGRINNRDLGLLQQYLNGWSVSIIDVAADVNVDGAINNRDFGLIQQYLNEWDVVFG